MILPLRCLFWALKWFHKDWWAYLFEKPRDPGYCSWPTRLWCRLTNHPDGVWWYNAGGLAPNTNCRRCADDLG